MYLINFKGIHLGRKSIQIAFVQIYSNAELNLVKVSEITTACTKQSNFFVLLLYNINQNLN